MFKRQKNNVIDEIKSEIRKVYIETGKTPWIIGYSGGKDSTTVLQLTIEVLIDLQRDNLATKDVYVISSDTLIENPMVIAKTLRSMENINKFALESKIPLKAEMVYPDMKDTFFVNMIGRGYPSPLQSFRWCTDRIKIKPANNYIHNKIDENGEVILLLGTREEESISRKRSMDKHKIEGSTLSLHSSINSAWTYAPIAKLTVNEIWSYLLKNECPWHDDNNELYKMYADSSAGECPLVIDSETKNQQSCGNSRFGCWTCTVVQEDKSLTGFIESGETWLKPFLDFRKYMIDIRDDETYRNLFDRHGNLKKVELKRKDDQVIIPRKLNRDETRISINEAVTEAEAYRLISEDGIDPRNGEDRIIVFDNGKYYRIGVSGFTYQTRMEMLRKLLDVEASIRKTLPEYQILQHQEVQSIDELWQNYGYADISALEIYNEYHPDTFVIAPSTVNKALLKELAVEFDFNETVLLQIVNNTNKNKTIKNRNSNIKYIGKKLEEHRLQLVGNNDH